MPGPRTSLLTLHTTWGDIRVAVRGGRVVECTLPFARGTPASAPRVESVRCDQAAPGDRAVLRAAERFVRAALAGRAAPCPPVEMPKGAPFFAACRRAMQRVPRGRTVTYRELSARAGRAAAVRAAGQACARNPLPLFVPCHRILASGGGLGGFSGGLAWKRHLLEAESGS
ncbi:MAG TPA: methylated-DNA--[protein]-cysteine S-methyltransferase [Kiritimatiellia bacterium]|nr:methylated-DNA--[protein]-cysteine S-methyltransferase [Kiritimatiellia bacterium]